MSTVETLPPDTSKKGDNTYLVSCDVYGADRHYAACLNVKKLADEGKSRPIDRDCCRAMITGECPAMKMMEEERVAGKALYYVKREAPIRAGSSDVTSDQYQLSWARGSQMGGARKGKPPVTYKDFDKGAIGAEPSREKTKVVTGPKRIGVSAPVGSGGSVYADLVNKMMQDHEKKSEVTE